ncbi:hypothetical protein ACFLWZ_02315 [Chloroflexota bacterium]
MLIVGELINSSRKSIRENMEQRNIDFFLNIARTARGSGRRFRQDGVAQY